MTRNVFDQAARYCVQCDPIGFLRWLIRGLSRALLFQGWLDTRTLPFPGGHDRTCDMVADLAEHADAERRWAVINEFQTEPDRISLPSGERSPVTNPRAPSAPPMAPS